MNFNMSTIHKKADGYRLLLLFLFVRKRRAAGDPSFTAGENLSEERLFPRLLSKREFTLLKDPHHFPTLTIKVKQFHKHYQLLQPKRKSRLLMSEL